MGKEYIRSTSIIGQLPFANRIVLSDDFEDLLKWTQFEGTGDSVFELDPSLAKHGNQSLFMQTRTTSHAEDDIIGAQRIVHLLPTKVLTLLSNFYMPSTTNTKNIEFIFQWSDATLLHTASIIHNTTTHYWQYYNAGETYVNILDSNIALLEAGWHLLKIDVNLGIDRYISLQIDHMIFNLSGFSSFSAGNGSRSQLTVNILAHASVAGPGSLNIDDTSIYEV